MTGWRRVRRQARAWQVARTRWKADRDHLKDARARNGTAVDDRLGPPPSGFTLLPWLLMGMGSFTGLLQGRTPHPWLGGLGLLAFGSLYIYVTFRSFDRERRNAASTRVALGLMGLLTTALALGYGGNWLAFFPLVGLAAGAMLRGPRLGRTGLLLAVYAGGIAGLRGGWGDAMTIGYSTFISGMVTAAVLSLSEAVQELRAAREELARRAVEKERLRFSRDLHDLLGHTLSVIVVKSEAARRLARRDMSSALEQVEDIESVGRQALTEIREAVTGYREGSLATELTRARSALSAASVEPVVRQSGTPLAPQTEALLGWVVREAVTNIVRHSDASRCEIVIEGAPERVRLTVTDNGTSTSKAVDRTVGSVGGTGLKGLTERLAAAGGSLTARPSPRGGFGVTAELPVDSEELTGVGAMAPRTG
ncbi:sensor histidine kinase [Streptomyces pluripotens]|uniref:Sensor histidine kinase n=1 Tax=Streptomyces pluripotens TaxID=1355015 RepID=A0A221NWP0_9ACTN|nr:MULTISPECIES: sensor histidine kinase [Streptomyces]ARP69987.1 two-component sensor histidine kinase [Streptomyces pluripotens]ASN24246.1 sensor histidine kinase [Streptomyces pluripotens]KIE25279.1 histidine kinase [Streptomyces sp. MUSC 125]MCH0559992.1 sensor histidine kinase [Streptomyces sp. MUM 16J]